MIFIENNKLIIFLFIMILCDLTSGFINACKRKELKSSIFRNGGFKKILIIIVVTISYCIDFFFFEKEYISSATVIYYIINEIISIFENVSLCGVKIPKQLKEILNNLSEKE